MGDLIEEFNTYRAQQNERILQSDNKVLKRIFNLDTNAFADTAGEGGLSGQVKELLGLSTSMVLRCDDCIKYHLGKCYEVGLTRKQVFEAFAIANLVGGTIMIPHLRRAVEYWDALEAKGVNA